MDFSPKVIQMAWNIRGASDRIMSGEEDDIMALGQRIAEIHAEAERLGLKDELMDYLEYTSKAREMEMDFGRKHGHNEPMLKPDDFKRDGRRSGGVWAANDKMDEGLSSNGSMGLGGHGEGFEVQNQGVTRRNPGEGPKVNGGRSQSQEMDSMDQPQYESVDDDAPEGFMTCPACLGMGTMVTGPGMEDDDPDLACPECMGTGEVSQFKGVEPEDTGFMPIKEFMGVRDADTLDKQDTHVGSQESGGPIGESDRGAEREYSEHGKSMQKLGVDRKSSKKIAKAIARDHRKEDPNYYRNEGVMPLREFFLHDKE